MIKAYHLRQQHMEQMELIDAAQDSLHGNHLLPNDGIHQAYILHHLRDNPKDLEAPHAANQMSEIDYFI